MHSEQFGASGTAENGQTWYHMDFRMQLDDYHLIVKSRTFLTASADLCLLLTNLPASTRPSFAFGGTSKNASSLAVGHRMSSRKLASRFEETPLGQLNLVSLMPGRALEPVTLVGHPLAVPRLPIPLHFCVMEKRIQILQGPNDTSKWLSRRQRKGQRQGVVVQRTPELIVGGPPSSVGG